MFWTICIVRYLAVVPATDFVGDLYWVDFFDEHFVRGHLPQWTRFDGLGHAVTPQWASILLFLPAVALKHVFGDTVVASQVWLAAVHTLSWLTFYRLARGFVSRGGAAIGACAYLLAPIHLHVLSYDDGWQVAVSFMLVPWVLKAALDCVRDKRGGRGSLVAPASKLALVLTWSMLADAERTIVFFPIMAGVLALAVRASRGPSAAVSMKRLAIGFGLAAGICSAFTLPFYLEREHVNLLREPAESVIHLFRRHHERALFHPLDVLEGGAWHLFNPFFAPRNRGYYHYGWLLVSMATIATVVAMWSRRSSARASSLTRYGVGFGTLVLVAIWLASGERSWARASAELFASSPMIVVASAAVWFSIPLVARYALGVRAMVVAAVLIAVLGFVPSASVMARLPVYAEIKVATWFLVDNVPLLASLLVALLVDHASRQWNARARATLASVAVACATLDYGFDPVRMIPSTIDVPGLRAAFGVINADPAPIRYLPYPYAESSADEGFALRFSRKASASSWLLWTCSRSGVARIARSYAELAALERAESFDENAARAVLEGLAELGIKYLLVPESYQGLRWLEDAGLVARRGARVLENLVWRVDSSVHALAGDPVPYRRSDDETWSFTPPREGAYVIAEAWYPFWKASVDGVPIAIRESSGGLIEVVVDRGPMQSIANRGSQVRVVYQRPAAYAALNVLAPAALLLALVRAVRGSKRGVRRRATP